MEIDKRDNLEAIIGEVFEKYPTSEGLRKAVATLLEKQPSDLVLLRGDLFSIRENKRRF